MQVKTVYGEWTKYSQLQEILHFGDYGIFVEDMGLNLSYPSKEEWTHVSALIYQIKGGDICFL